ncbi:MAG: hypothetical protein RMH77_00085 [Sulfolobales archaeon]|nr:hypothetical protein [Sulfolobales archaeon]MDW7968800.1 hypothetical protein [Sulfolobales archaeon]
MRLNPELIILATLPVFLIAFHPITTSAQITALNIYIDNYGVTYVTQYVNITQGINSLEIPMRFIEGTINISCDGILLPWIRADVEELLITSNESCTATVTYIADVDIVGGIFTLNISNESIVKMVIEDRVLLLSVPENLLSAMKEGNRTAMTFKAPATLNYTIIEPQNMTSPTTKTEPPTQTTQAAAQPLQLPIIILLIAITAITLILIAIKKK